MRDLLNGRSCSYLPPSGVRGFNRDTLRAKVYREKQLLFFKVPLDRVNKTLHDFKPYATTFLRVKL